MNKMKWNFKLIYKSDKDPQIEKDLKERERQINRFSKKYKFDNSYLTSNKGLLSLIKDYEKILDNKRAFAPVMYFYFKKDIESTNRYAQSELNKLYERYSKMDNELIFFQIELGKVDEKRQKEILQAKELERYKYFFEKLFKEAKYNLSLEEEKILNLMSQPAHNMWVDGLDRILSKEEVVFEGKSISLGEAQNMLPNLKALKRRKLYKLVMEKLEMHKDFAEAEVNAVVTGKKIKDELRKFKNPYSSTVLRYENEDKTVENLIDTITSNFKISHKFYKIKARMLKLEKLGYEDRSAKVGNVKKEYDIEETLKLLRNAFGAVDKKYVTILNQYLKNGQIDVYPKKGKTGGAYCFGNYGQPTFVLLNHVNNLNSVTTFAHELGHAFHTELSHNQNAVYRDYTIAVAEVASTLFENFVFEEVLKTLSEKEKTIALHDRIQDQVSTIFRQVACFNFENELHNRIREVGYLSHDEIKKMLNKHMMMYLGDAFSLKDIDGNFYITWSHIRNFFYVYSYAFGSLVSDALYFEYTKDNKFLTKIEEFLEAGCSKSPENIFKDIGIDVTKKDFFRKGLKVIEKNIERLDKLVN